MGLIVILGLVIWSGKEPITQAFNALSNLTFSSWLILTLLVLTMMGFHGMRWFYLLRGAEQKTRLRDIYSILFVAYFVNQLPFLPLRPGSPLRVVLGNKKLKVPFSVSTLIIIIEEALDVLVTGALALGSIYLLSSSGIPFSNSLLLIVILISAVVLLFGLIFRWNQFVGVLINVLLRLLPTKMREKLTASNLSSTQNIEPSKYLVGGFLLTIGYWTFRFELFRRILMLVDVSIGFIAVATIISTSFLVSVLSMIPGGWGVKELTITMLLVSLGVNEQIAQTAAFLDRGVLLIFILILGGISSVHLRSKILLRYQIDQNDKDTS